MDSFLDRLTQVRNRHLLLIDLVLLSHIPFLAVSLALDHTQDMAGIVADLTPSMLIVSITFLLIKLAVLYKFALYRCYWQYASLEEVVKPTLAIAIIVALQSIALQGLIAWVPLVQQASLPWSLPLLDGLLSLLAILGVRTILRLSSTARCYYQATQQLSPNCQAEPTLIVGAGSAAIDLVAAMLKQPELGFIPVAFVDDDPTKLGLQIRDIVVLGDRYAIPQLVQKLGIRRAVIAMPSVSGSVIREVVGICQQVGLSTSTLPSLQEILSGIKDIGVNSLREIRIEDLLRRDPIRIDTQQVMHFLQGRRVLVTGAGGSIGSELCRQILQCQPSSILLLGKGENSVFEIEQELKTLIANTSDISSNSPYNANSTANNTPYPDSLKPSINTFIADLRNPSRLEKAIQTFKPDVIFHAAAHKHVPLMEIHPSEAITSNIQGTQNLLNLATRYGIQHFVMVSTDKAVNPTSIMGATKRIAEMLVLQAAKVHGYSYTVVRFGNVLGSRGSVIPTFKRQIEAGGPITITHPDICRYFMTIPEAVNLVLQAAVIGYPGTVLMLDMGNPIKVTDLAKDLIKLSGLQLDRDIKLKFTGLRPGEKLYEELFLPDEEYYRTSHDKIFMVHNASNVIPSSLSTAVEGLYQAAEQSDLQRIQVLLKQLVAGYQPSRSLSDLKLLDMPEPPLAPEIFQCSSARP